MDEDERTTYRDVWAFEYEARALAARASAIRDREEAATEKWEQVLAAAEAAIKTAGVVTRERIVTGGTQYEAVIDPEKQQAVAHAKSKAVEHRKRAVEYGRWATLFGAAPAARTFPLTVKDAEYFEL